jgi:signal transduction histidine kinase
VTARAPALRRFWSRHGARARDVVFIVVAVLSTIAEALARRDEGALIWAPVLVVGLAGAAALWWRRQHPVAVTTTGVVVFAITQVPVVLAVGLFSLAIRRRDRVLVLMTLVTAAAFTVVPAVQGSSSWVGFLASGLVEAALLAAAGSYIGARRDLLTALRDRAAQAEEQQELRAEQAMLGERARIAREMHDVLAHKVSLIAMHAGALEVNAAAGPEQVRQTAGVIRTTAREAMEDLRDVLGVLRAGTDGDGTDLAPPPGGADIERVVEASRAAGVRTDLTMEVGDMPDAVARTVHRVVQEALTNVHKHARDAATSVRITGDGARGVTVEVVNRRPVGSAALLPGSGAGLLGLRERLALVGGTLESGPCPDGGWRVVAWLPAAPASAATATGPRA